MIGPASPRDIQELYCDGISHYVDMVYRRKECLSEGGRRGERQMPCPKQVAIN